MARINSLLSIVVDQGANELRVGSGREPKMLAYGTPKRLMLPAVTDQMLRDLLGEILSAEVEALMKAQGRADVSYDAGPLGHFKATLTPRSDGIDAAFVRAPAANAAGSKAAAPRVESTLAWGPSTQPFPPPSPMVQAVPTNVVQLSVPASTLMAGPPAPATAPPPAVVAEPNAEEVRAVDSPLAAWVALAAAMNASDLHLSDGAVPIARVEGVLRPLDHGAQVEVAALFAREDYQRLLRERSIDLAVDVPGVRRARVHAYATADGLAAAIRLLPLRAPAFSQLQMPIAFDDLVSLSHGLVLVCGASGSGKSTTVAALAQRALDRRSIVLITLEDPIEYGLEPGAASVVRRRQVGRDVKDFASGLRDALREDPDVLIVGEMRDAETISLALTAAETGHLVLASIHSRGAASAIARIVDSYPPERHQQIRVQLADSVRAIIAQHLLPRARGNGRIPAVEVMRGTHAVANVIREGKLAQLGSVIQSARSEGMIMLERCLADRVQAGEVRLEDARAAADDVALFTSFLSRPAAH